MGTKVIDITRASRNDFSDIQALFRKMFEIFHVDQNIEYPYTGNGISYLRNCIEHRIALVAKDNERTVGFLTGGIEAAPSFKTYRQHGHIHNLYVLEEYRGQGIGKRLILRFIQICEENDVGRIITDSDDIEILRRFYTSLGFRISGVNYEFVSTRKNPIPGKDKL
ncbi:MAG: GNAT family N-acetyltransferase [Phycisphaerales bacterium]|nr:MAG: GNAT family N-acetyltransferase [Phycisphaerales bacterium]